MYATAMAFGFIVMNSRLHSCFGVFINNNICTATNIDTTARGFTYIVIDFNSIECYINAYSTTVSLICSYNTTTIMFRYIVMYAATIKINNGFCLSITSLPNASNTRSSKLLSSSS